MKTLYYQKVKTDYTTFQWWIGKGKYWIMPGLLFLGFTLILFITGCGSYGTLAASAGLPHPMEDVQTYNEKAQVKLASLEATDKLNPEAIAVRNDVAIQQLTRLRAAAAIEASATAPAVPELPSGDKSGLSQDRLRDTATAAALLKDVDLSPFQIISNTRDIYETLIPAHLRFEFDSLCEKQGYTFYQVPITLSVEPGTGTDENYSAEFAFEIDKIERDISIFEDKDIKKDKIENTNIYTKDIINPSKKDKVKQVISKISNWSNFKWDSLKLTIGQIKTIYTDTGTTQTDQVRIFTISPLRQYDSRAESLAKRLQLELAMQISVSGKINESASGAAKAAFDQVRRLEQDFATITQQPEITGFVSGERAFGWRIHPVARMNDSGKAIGWYMRPGPRDCLVILAVKADGKRFDPETGIYYPTIPHNLTLKATARWRLKATARWREILYRIFAKENHKPDTLNVGSYNMDCGNAQTISPPTGDPTPTPDKSTYLKIYLPGTPGREKLSATLESNKKIDLSKGPQLLILKGAGFSDETRIVIGLTPFTPSSFTPTTLSLLLNKKSLPNSDDKAYYKIIITDGPKRIFETTDTLKVNNPPEKPEKKASVAFLPELCDIVTPGQFLQIKYEKGKDGPELKSISQLEIWFGTQPIPSDAIKVLNESLFGFMTPNLPSNSIGPISVVVTIDKKLSFVLRIPCFKSEIHHKHFIF